MLMPESVKPVPVIAAALMVTAAVPEEVSVTDCDVGVFTFTWPKLRLGALSVSPANAGFSWIG